MYCPNCDAELAVDANACSACGADFGGQSAWRPLPQPQHRRTGQPISSGVPKVEHAWQSVVFFVLVGPLVGLLAFAFGYDWEFCVPVWIPLMGALAIGGPAALIAGILYCGLALAVVFRFPTARVSAWLGAVLGAVAGLLGAIIYYRLILSGAPIYSNKVSLLTSLAMPAGLISGLLSGWLFPVGRHKSKRGLW
jgi:hypothetical protein